MEVLDTPRLLIRRFTGDDGEELYLYLSREEVVRFEPHETFSLEESRAEAVRRSADQAFWAVCLKDSGALIGNLYFQQQEPKEFRTWELGYVFNNDYHNRGYAEEACLKILEYGFGILQARRVTAHCNPRNTPSWRLLEKLKFRREGHFLKTGFFKYDEQGAPKWHDTYAYGLLASEW